jgi:hypothetical protein
VEVLTTSAPVDGGNASGCSRLGRSLSNWSSRSPDWRAATKPFQFAIATSTGASARAVRIEPAMMMPPVASWLMTR